MSFKRFSHLGDTQGIEPKIGDVRGFQVLDSAGKPLGVVDDLLIADTGERKSADYILVGQGSIATMFSGKELIVPLDRLNVAADSKTVRLDVTMDELWDFPTYSTLDEQDLKDSVDSFWSATKLPHPMRHDVTVSYPASMESPAPIPAEVEPSKLPAGNPRIAAGLESPIPESIIEHAVASAEGKTGSEPEAPREAEKKSMTKKPEGEEPAA